MELFDLEPNFGITNFSVEFLMTNKDNNLSNCCNYQMRSQLQNSDTTYHMPKANFICPNLSKADKSEIPLMLPNQISNNIKSKFENFTKYVSSKKNNFMKCSMENWNQMNTGCSDFITSPKEYSSYFNNSRAMYLVGGFVGSKSQMNNEKHKLSYDLGEIIFNILHDYKSFDKGKEEKKFDVSKCGKKSKSLNKDSNASVFIRPCDILFYDNFSNNSLEIGTTTQVDVNCGVMSTKSQPLEEKDKHSNHMISEKVGVSNQDSVTKTSSAFDRLPKISDTCTSSTKESIKNDIQHQICLKTLLQDNVVPSATYEKQSNNKSNISNDPANNKNNCINNVTKIKPEDLLHLQYNELSEIRKQKNDSNPCKKSCSFTSHLLTENKMRQYSECSIESTDSESFIVFDDGISDANYDELQNPVLYDSENESDDCLEDDYNNDEDEDDFNYLDIDNLVGEDEIAGSSEGDDDNTFCKKNVENNICEEIAEANAKWSESYRDISTDLDESKRNVAFSDKVEIHRIIAWDYAYRAARVGPWEQMSRDRDRFMQRIGRLSTIISPVLFEDHRKLIYDKFYV